MRDDIGDREEVLAHTKDFLGCDDKMAKGIMLIHDKLGPIVIEDVDKVIKPLLQGMSPQEMERFLNAFTSFVLMEISHFYMVGKISLKIKEKKEGGNE